MHIENRDRRVEVVVVFSFFLQLLYFIIMLTAVSKSADRWLFRVSLGVTLAC
jgi:hypothetical protein